MVIRILFISLTKALSAQLVDLARLPAIGRVLVPNISHFTMMMPTVLLGTFKVLEMDFNLLLWSIVCRISGQSTFSPF